MERVICLHKRWAAEILSGRKRVEVRNTKSLPLGLIGICAQGIVDLIFGTVEVISVQRKSFGEILAMSSSTGISDAHALREYVRGDQGYVYTLRNAVLFDRPVWYYSDGQGNKGSRPDIPAAVDAAVRSRFPTLSLSSDAILNILETREELENTDEAKEKRYRARVAFGKRIPEWFKDQLYAEELAAEESARKKSRTR